MHQHNLNDYLWACNSPFSSVLISKMDHHKDLTTIRLKKNLNVDEEDKKLEVLDIINATTNIKIKPIHISKIKKELKNRRE